MSNTIRHAIRNRWTDAVIYEADIPADTPSGMQARAVLKAVNPARAYLSGAYLAGADLSGANLAGAYLSGADLAGANIARADLSGAYLSGADLAGANLSGANIADAYLSGADLAGAKWTYDIAISRAPLQISGLRWMVYILDQHMQIGCQLHTLAEWDAFDDSSIVAMDGKDALRFWRAHKAALLALAHSDGRGVMAPVAEAA